MKSSGVPTVEELTELMANLRQQHAALTVCQQEQTSAYSRELEALSSTNRLQKELDLAITAMRKAAPRGTDWHSKYVLLLSKSSDSD